MTDAKEKIFQYQDCGGDWNDIESLDRNKYLDAIVNNNDSINSHSDAIDLMGSGEKLRNDSMDWYSNCRMFDKLENEKRIANALKRKNKKQLYIAVIVVNLDKEDNIHSQLL